MKMGESVSMQPERHTCVSTTGAPKLAQTSSAGCYCGTLSKQQRSQYIDFIEFCQKHAFTACQLL